MADLLHHVEHLVGQSAAAARRGRAGLDGLVQGLRQHAQEDLDRALRQALGATVGPPQDVFGCCQSLELLVAVKELGLGCRQALSG